MMDNFCYVAKHPDMPGFYAACVDDEKYKKDTAKDISAWIKEGAIVIRVTSDEARNGLLEYINFKKENKILSTDKVE